MKLAEYSVSGYMGDAELKELARLAGNGTVLEIGTWNGRSAIWMALGGATVYCLDTFLSDDMGPGIAGGWTLGNLIDSARKYQVHERIKPLCDAWQNLLPGLDLTRFTLLHYDADHSYEATVAACRCLLKSPVPLCVHDYNWPEPKRAVDDLAEQFDRRLRVVGALAVLEIP
ncbi:MAG: class I SAM-dependent methyltransferase [Planctomycetota bacterium]|nr:class I SAM-dependent methyltransferase [Planctomycetota bacterium]